MSCYTHKMAVTILRSPYENDNKKSYDILTTNVKFTKHLTKDARLFFGRIRLQKSLDQSETVFVN